VDEPTALTLVEAARLVEARSLSPVELTESHLRRIESVDHRVKAFVTVLGDRAIADARTAEAEIAAGCHRGPLHGVPVVVKDLIATAGVRTTAGSRILKDWVPDEDAPVVRDLKGSGAVIVGKATTHEFAASVFTPPTRNPWRLDCIPGGSSGGSAAALAAHMCMGAVGTDTAGSIRIPASLCGVVGIKPTYDLVSRRGVVPLSWSLDHVGSMARTVEDVAILLGVMAQRPARPPRFREPAGLRLGVPSNFFFDDLDDEVEAAVVEAIDRLAQLGLHRRDVRVPTADVSAIAGDAILLPESSAYHARWLRTRPQDYAADVRTLLEMGELVLATDYLRGQRARAAITQEFARAFQSADVIVAPMTRSLHRRTTRIASTAAGVRRACSPRSAASTIPRISRAFPRSRFHVVSRAAVFPSGFSSSDGHSMRGRCCASRTPISRRRRGTDEHRSFLSRQSRIEGMRAEKDRGHCRSRICGSAPRNLSRFPNMANRVKIVPAIRMKTTATAAMVGVNP
jgi:aspartyl-tRNA(Asn)/glutamyl-tRNA(Gln) amidotransferase subunit A